MRDSFLLPATALCVLALAAAPAVAQPADDDDVEEIFLDEADLESEGGADIEVLDEEVDDELGEDGVPAADEDDVEMLDEESAGTETAMLDEAALARAEAERMGKPAMAVRSMQLAPGGYHARATLGVTGGPGEDGVVVGSNYVILAASGGYIVNDTYEVGGRLLASVMAPVTKPETLTGAFVYGRRRINDSFSGFVELGYALPTVNSTSELSGHIFTGDMKAGGHAGVVYHRRMMDGKLDIIATPRLNYQRGSTTDAMGVRRSLKSVSLPVTGYYRYSDKIMLSAFTGPHARDGVSFGAADGGTLPLVVGGNYQMSKTLEIGAQAGYASILAAPETGLYPTAGTSLFLGANVRYLH